MTIAASPTKVIYAGDGVTTSFPVTMPLYVSDGSDLQLTVFDNLGNPTVLTANYTFNFGALTISYPSVGGVAPLAVGVNALPVGWQLVIARIEPLSQLASPTDQGFSASAVMSAMDKIVMMCQQLQEQVSRAVLVPINTPGPATPVVAPTVSPFGLVQVNGTWAQLVAYAQAAPTQQFVGYVTSGDQAGQWFFYSGDVNVGNMGFIAAGGG